MAAAGALFNRRTGFAVQANRFLALRFAMEKDFDKWNTVKQALDQREQLPVFNEREVWWCSVGMNVGFEIFGKDERFWRPVLVLGKHSRHTFFGLPFGSTIKPNNPRYFALHFRGREGSVLLSQGRTLSSKRLSNKIGKLPHSRFNEIRKAFKSTI